MENSTCAGVAEYARKVNGFPKKVFPVVVLLSLLFGALMTSCSSDKVNGTGGTQGETYPSLANLVFLRPLDLQYPGDGSGRLFVLEQQGKIFAVSDNGTDIPRPRKFLDIRDRVRAIGTEEGLLGMAFHPQYAANGYLFVNYTASNPQRTVVSRFTVSATDPDSADVTSEIVILEVAQPYSNHNGGCIRFGLDGYLYIGMGDGGLAGDPDGNGQNLQTLLGALLRIDVDEPSGGRNYGIPPDNPFVGNSNGYREEIFAYGLRNPWRFSFDGTTGRLWLGDVGQSTLEEIDIIEAGGNYGWDTMEGTVCFTPPTGCDTTGLAMPIWAYGRGLGYSVTGGVVYRGSALASYTGDYIYADYGTGRIWALRYNGVDPPQNIELKDTALNIVSFGVDGENEVYICSLGGRIYRLQDILVE